MAVTDQRRALISEFQTLLEKSKNDAAVFALLTVVLTPVFVVAAVAALFFALYFVDLPGIDHLGFVTSFLTGVNLTVAFMLVSYFLRPKPNWQRHQSDTMWLAIACCLFGALLVLSYATPLSKTHPILFWPIYLFLSLAMLACMGHAYEPHDDYYLGWVAGPVIIDNPFTIEDDIDRAHMSLGFVTAISHLILESYASIFASKWLWHTFEYGEVAEAVQLLQAIASNDPAGARSRLQRSPSSASNIVRALVKLELVTIQRGNLRLSVKGRDFLSAGSGSAGLRTT